MTGRVQKGRNVKVKIWGKTYSHCTTLAKFTDRTHFQQGNFVGKKLMYFLKQSDLDFRLYWPQFDKSPAAIMTDA